MLKIQTAGNAYERGVQLGCQCRTIACEWLSQKKVSAYPSIMPPPVEYLADILPETYRKCLGIADGLEISREQYFQFIFDTKFFCATPQCSIFGTRTSQNGVVLAKTDDVSVMERGINVLEIETSEDGNVWAHFHFSATVWTTAGMNQAGLAIAMTGIPGRLGDEHGVWSLYALDGILHQCVNVTEVIDLLGSIPVNRYGFSLILGDAEGNIELIECNADGVCVLTPQIDNWYCHTNHILDASLAASSPSQSEPLNTNSRQRFKRLCAGLKNYPKHMINAPDVATNVLLDSHGTTPICQCGDSGYFTDYAVIFLPQHGRMIHWPDNPVNVEPEETRMVDLQCRR